ncbi:uncharacterized protein [Euwallacea similis]|uniref:uncharacterized protein n=1 Tax=Euwallacea similis TaxID=1736056 RepID=UPI00344BF90B
MGVIISKITRSQRRTVIIKEQKKQVEVKEQLEECDGSDSILVARQDAKYFNAIRNDLNENPEIFVLNNVLMCTFFLKNYQEEIYKAKGEVDKPQDNFWEPHTIIEKANRNVIYRAMHGARKDIPEPLVTRRIYVPMNEYVEVCDLLSESEDLSNSSRYQVKMEESRRRGFVRLRRINANACNDGNSMKDVPVVSTSSTTGTSDTDSMATPNDKFSNGDPQLVNDDIDDGTPDDCFVYRKIKKQDADMLLEDGEDLQEEDVYDIVSYLHSRKFMKYFQSKVFKDPIAKQLSIVQYEIDHAVVYQDAPGKVFCNVRSDIESCYPVELMPCLKSSWPDKQTFGFLTMEPTSNDQHYLQWPSKKMFQYIKMTECALVPKGYALNGKFSGDLDWEIHFPMAERYLETCLRPEQIHCYLVLLSIFKEYIEPHTKSFGILPEHLANLIFWETEKDNVKWPKYQLGHRLMEIIKYFSNCLSERKFQDYFMRNRNIFRNIPLIHLDAANKTFHAITQSPTMLIIRALRNIRYLSAYFYPPLNYKELLDILYKKNWNQNSLLAHMNLPHSEPDNISVSTATSTKKKSTPKDAVKQLHLQKEKKLRKEHRRERQKEDGEIKRGSLDSINDDWVCEKHFDVQKKIALLKFFINCYIDIAKTSMKIASKKQTLFYLKQAWYLTKILQQENQLFAEEVKDYFKEIKKHEDLILGIMQSNIEEYGNMDVLNNNAEVESEEEDNLSTLDDVSDQLPEKNEKKIDTDITIDDIHQQIRQKKIKLSTLTKTFKPNYFKSTPIEEYPS